MPRFFITRVEEEYGGEPIASINIFRDGTDLQIEVRAKSRMIRDHLKEVLASPFYQLSPMNYLAAGISANYSLYIEPNTKLFLMYLIDRLGWYGYIINPVSKNVVAKSIYDLHYSYTAVANVSPDRSAIVLKAMGGGCGSSAGGEMYYNKSGELVVMRVPAGCMAVSADGRVVGPGKYLHARVNTPDSPWSLIEVPKNYNTYMRTLQNTEKIAEKKGKTDLLEKVIERNKKMLQKLMDEGKLEYSPAYHLLTNLQKKEEVEVETEKGTEKVYTSYVEIPEEEKKQFEVQIAQILDKADKLDLTPREMKVDQEPPFNPALGSAGQVNVAEAVYYNPQLGLIATADMMPRLLQAFRDEKGVPKGVWKFALPEEYQSLVNNPEAIIEEAEKLIQKGEKMSPWLAAQYHLLRNRKAGKGGIEAGRVDFNKMASKYNMDIDRLRDLSIDKEFIGRINSLVSVAKVENSQYEPLEFVEEIKPSLEELENDPNEEAKVKALAEFKTTLLDKVMDVNEEGILHFKTDVSKIKDTPKSFKDIAGTASKEYWNEKKFKLNRPGLGNYQAVLAKLISYPKMYSWFGGPKQSKGFDLNLEQGTGKTVIMLAAEAAMRSMKEFKDHFKAKIRSGGQWKEIDRFTMIVAPNAHTWANTLKEARKENAVVIAGTRQEREQQWEKLMRDIEAGKTTARYIVVGTGKFRSDKEEIKISEEEEAEYQVDSMDVRYMKMLMTGFRSSKTNKVVSRNGLVANFVLDEAGLFVNEQSNRTRLMREIRALATSKRNKGLFFTLNGEILSNSLDDVVYRLAYVNDKAFGGEDAILGRYGERLGGKFVLTGTKWAAQLKKEAEQMKGPYWEAQKQTAINKLHENVLALQSAFPNSFRLNMKMISGKDLKTVQTHQTGLSGTFAKLYMDVFTKFKTIKQLSSAARDNQELKEIIQAYSLGAFSTLINASFGAANPRTLLEYGIGTPMLWKKIEQRLRQKHKLDIYPDDKERRKAFEEELKSIRGEIDAYLDIATEQPFSGADGVGSPLAKFAHIFPQIPKSSKKTHIDEKTGQEKAFTTAYREKLWKDMVSEGTRQLLNDIIYDEEDPVTNAIIQKAHTLLNKSANPDSDKKRLVIGSGSRIVAEKVAKRLEKQYGGKVEVQIITGDTPARDREKIEQVHQQSDKPVITIVTNAGARGLNLQAPYLIRTPLWSAGQAVQMDARARRDPGKPLKVVKVVSTGAASYMNETEELKSKLADIFDTGADYDDVDEFLEKALEKMDINTIIERLEELNVNIDV